jgi:hypothetical protein
MEGRVLRSGTTAWTWDDLDYPMLAVDPHSAPAVLLPAVQKVQPAAAGVTDGTSNTVLVAEGSLAPAEPRYFAGFTSRFSAGGE